MAARWFAVTEMPLSQDDLQRAIERDVQARGEGCGAICAFAGIVRATHRGRRVRYLEYEAFDTLAVKVFEQIGGEVLTQWPDTRVAIHHRIGRLEIGEASVVLAAAAPHRAAAFHAARYAIERIKQVAPIWKHEFFEDGDAWVEGATADPADEAARLSALSTACA
jgi:molybdopterin synthase catalytic subunit